MKFWLKIEEKINQFLTWFWAIFKSFVQRKTPKKIHQFIDRTNNFIEQKKQKLHENFEKLKASIAGIIPAIKEKVSAFSKKLNDLQEWAKKINVRGLTLKKIILIFFGLFTPLLTKIKTWVIALDPKIILTVVVTTSAGSVATIYLYTSSQRLANNVEKQTNRKVASLEKQNPKLKNRPTYYKIHEKRLRIDNVRLPVYIGEDSDLRVITIDFSLQSSNRYIPEYFFTNTILINDKLNTTVEPIIPSFPLTPEGKEIIKEKLKTEINALIKELKIGGKIEDVYIHSVIGG